MSLRKLPEIKAFDSLSHLQFEPDDAIVARWNPGVRAAVDEDDATITIYDAIGSDWQGEGVTAKRISAALRKIGTRDVTVNVNSPGGDFFEGIAIYNLLREHKSSVTVQVMGLAASAASIIAMAGDEIRVSEAGFLMIHNAWAMAIGNRHDMIEAAELLEPFDAAMAGVYATRAGVDVATAAGWMDDETWFSGKKSVENGLADGLLAGDEIKDDATKASMKTVYSLRRIDAALARQGITRAERRTLLTELKGDTQDAVVTVTQDAGDLMADIGRLNETIRSLGANP